MKLWSSVNSMVWNLCGYTCGHESFRSAGMCYSILQNDIVNYVPKVLVHGIDFGEYSS